MRSIVYALLPLAVLLVLTVCASLIGYALLQMFGDFWPLARAISKTTLLLLLLMILPLKKLLRLSWAELGFAPRAVFFKQMGQGLFLAIVTLLPMLLILYFLDVHVWDAARHWTLAKVGEKIGLALFFALLIALGEEILFRGLLFGSLQRKIPLIAVVAISSFYYAALHFLKSKSKIPYAELSIDSGFKLVVEAYANWLNPEIASAFIALFVVGVFLAMLRSSGAQSLGLSIGCHAGWVWQIKVSKDLFNVNSHSQYSYLVSSYDGVVGPLISVWLAIAIAAWWLLNRAYSDSKLKSAA